MIALRLYFVGALFIFGCRPQHAGPGTAAKFAFEIGKPGQTLRGVAGDGAMVFSARGDTTSGELEARKGEAIAWHAALPGSAGPVAYIPGLVIATLTASGAIATTPPAVLHGEPGSVAIAMDAKTGAVKWRIPFDSNEFAVITSIAGEASNVIVGGTFSGTLRVGDAQVVAGERRVVSSAGRSDGFVASINSATGAVHWVVRVGGAYADSVQGVATRDGVVAIAGTFGPSAELQGEPLVSFDEKLPFADAFVAELDATTGARKWSQTFGGRFDDSVAGVAIDSQHRVAVAATVRDTIAFAGRDLVTHGAGDGLVAWFSPTGLAGATTIIGGADFDGLRAIAEVDDRVVVGGFFHGAVAIGKQPLKSDGDDSFIAVVAPNGELGTVWQLSGPGREEITALTSVPGGFVAGVAHSAALVFDGATLAAPSDPTSGAVLVGRPL